MSASSGAELDQDRRRQASCAQRTAQGDERRVRVVVGGRHHRERTAGRGLGDRIGQHRGNASSEGGSEKSHGTLA